MFEGNYHLRHQSIEVGDIELKVILLLLVLSPRPALAVDEHDEEDGSCNEKATSHIAENQEDRRTVRLHSVAVREVKRRDETRVGDVDQKNQFLRL